MFQLHLMVRQSQNVFFKATVLPKTNEGIRWMKGFILFAYQYYEQIWLFVFWKNSRVPKFRFETNWPLILPSLTCARILRTFDSSKAAIHTDL